MIGILPYGWVMEGVGSELKPLSRTPQGPQNGSEPSFGLDWQRAEWHRGLGAFESSPSPSVDGFTVLTMKHEYHGNSTIFVEATRYTPLISRLALEHTGLDGKLITGVLAIGSNSHVVYLASVGMLRMVTTTRRQILLLSLSVCT